MAANLRPNPHEQAIIQRSNAQAQAQDYFRKLRLKGWDPERASAETVKNFGVRPVLDEMGPGPEIDTTYTPPNVAGLRLSPAPPQPPLADPLNTLNNVGGTLTQFNPLSRAPKLTLPAGPTPPYAGPPGFDPETGLMAEQERFMLPNTTGLAASVTPRDTSPKPGVRGGNAPDRPTAPGDHTKRNVALAAGGGALAMILGAIFGGKEGFASVGEGVAEGVASGLAESRRRRLEDEDRALRSGLDLSEEERRKAEEDRHKTKFGMDLTDAERAKKIDALNAARNARNYDKIEALSLELYSTSGAGASARADDEKRDQLFQEGLEVKKAQRLNYLEPNRYPPQVRAPHAVRVFDMDTGLKDAIGDPITQKMILMSDGTVRPALPGEAGGVDGQEGDPQRGGGPVGPLSTGYVSPVASGLAGDTMRAIGQRQPPPVVTQPPPAQGGLGATTLPDTAQEPLSPATPALLREGGIKPPKPFNEKSAIAEITSKSGWTARDVEAAVVDAMSVGMDREAAIRYVAKFNKVLLSR